MDDITLLPITRVCELIGLERASVYTQIKRGTLPPGVRFHANSTRWPAGEIRQVVQARIAGRSEDDIRALVARQLEQRKALAA